MSAGVVTVPGTSFGAPGHVRLGFAVEETQLRHGLRHRESPVFMTGNPPPDVPEVFDARYGAALDLALSRRLPSRLIGAHQYRDSDRDRATGAAFTARRPPWPRPEPTSTTAPWSRSSTWPRGSSPPRASAARWVCGR
ncbi:hypothetical protein [Streptomyces sp. NPDC102462]|uniref:hypothetical protein n=1 Tax=Streptomyces sp. NPDC102462 TaxID=3366178 RepID=UPI003830C7A3